MFWDLLSEKNNLQLQISDFEKEKSNTIDMLLCGDKMQRVGQQTLDAFFDLGDLPF